MDTAKGFVLRCLRTLFRPKDYLTVTVLTEHFDLIDLEIICLHFCLGPVYKQIFFTNNFQEYLLCDSANQASSSAIYGTYPEASRVGCDKVGTI